MKPVPPRIKMCLIVSAKMLECLFYDPFTFIPNTSGESQDVAGSITLRPEFGPGGSPKAGSTP